MEAKLQGQPLATSATAVVLQFLQTLQESLAAKGQPAAGRPAEGVERIANPREGGACHRFRRISNPRALVLNSASAPALNCVGVSDLNAPGASACLHQFAPRGKLLRSMKTGRSRPRRQARSGQGSRIGRSFRVVNLVPVGTGDRPAIQGSDLLLTCLRREPGQAESLVCR